MLTKEQRFKILRSHEWKEEEARASPLILDFTRTCYLDGFKIYNKKLFSVCIYCLRGNYYAFEWTSLDEVKRAFDLGFKKWRKEKIFFRKKNKEFEKICQGIKKTFWKVKKGIEDYPNNKLKELADLLFHLYREQYGYSIFTEATDTLTELDYLKFLPKVPQKSLNKIIQILTNLEELTFLGQEKLSLLEITKEVLDNKKLKKAVRQKSLKEIKKFPGFFTRLNSHTQEYFWIQNSFRGAVYLNNNYFLKQIAEIINKNSVKEIKEEIERILHKKEISTRNINKIYKKYKLSTEAKAFFEMIRYFAVVQDRRKENVQRLVFCIDQVLNEAGKRFKIKKEDLENYFVSEILKLLEKGKKLAENKLRQRERIILFSYIKNNKIETDRLFGKEAEEIIQFFEERRKKFISSGVIKGFVASVGKGEKIIKGRVRIVFNPAKDPFKKDEILVAGMTRPEFVPLMKKAKAIITNEGGVTTHAAIVSRELKKPCIIGTKIATDVLKNGDLIELNMNKGLIKILKRSK